MDNSLDEQIFEEKSFIWNITDLNEYTSPSLIRNEFLLCSILIHKEWNY